MDDTMAPPQINLSLMDDDARWADDTECLELLIAGVWQLHGTLKARHPKCVLLRRIDRLAGEFERIQRVSGGDAAKVSVAEVAGFMSELNTLGTLGYSIWHLRGYLDAPGLRYELKELSQLGCGENPAGDTLRIRGQGFLLLAAAHLAKEGFGLEFIPRRNGEQTPDFFATRDCTRYTCEVTNRYPMSGDFGSVEFFWESIQGVVQTKRNQLRGSEYIRGVLIVDCTPVWDAFGLARVPVGGVVAVFLDELHGGPRTVSAPMVRYDDTPHSVGLRGLEEVIQGSNIETLVLWNHQLELTDTGYHRRMEYRILGTLHGAAFWTYFPKTCVFPGPQCNVVWPPDVVRR